MTADPEAVLGTLPRADGSATYTHAGYTVTATANGPLEAPRRDEKPDEAVVDVVVRPAAGVGGPSERHLEAALRAALRQLVLVQVFPRCLIQVVLQVQAVPPNDYAHTRLNMPGLNLGLLPALLQSAVLALLAASIPMRTTATAASVAVVGGGSDGDGDGGAATLVSSFSPRDAAAARSTHVFAFAADDGRLLLAESTGAFALDEWDAALAAARALCCQAGTATGGAGGADGGVADGMALDDGGGRPATDLRGVLRAAVQDRVADALQWKTTTAPAG